MGIFNKQKAEKKLQLSEEQLEKCFKAGEKVGSKLKLAERVNSINEYGNKNPRRIFLFIFIGLIAAFSIGFLIPVPRPQPQPEAESVIPMVSPSANDGVEKFKTEMERIYGELELLTDTLGKALEKPNKTKEDSLFILEKYERFEYLQGIVNKEFKNEE